MSKKTRTSPIPQHIALIMDGNRRWAKQHGWEAFKGHEYALNKVIEPLVDECIRQGVQYLTLWLFSTENWNRDPVEVEGLMKLFRSAFTVNAAKLHDKGVRLMTIGDMSKFAPDIQEKAADWVEKTKKNDKVTLIFALNYGGRDDIVRAVNSLVASGEPITAETISNTVDTARQGIPDPELIIRPGGELRLSGFLLWQSEYAELYFTDKMAPEFTPAEMAKAIDNFAQRQRRFGK